MSSSQTAEQTNEPQPIFAADCWYFPDNAKSVFGSRKGRASVYTGWILLHDTETSQEVRRTQVSPRSVTRAFSGQILIDKDGKKQSIFSKPWASMFDPKLQLFILMPVIATLLLRLPVLLELILLLGAITGMIMLYAPGIKNAKQFAKVANDNKS